VGEFPLGFTDKEGKKELNLIAAVYCLLQLREEGKGKEGGVALDKMASLKHVL